MKFEYTPTASIDTKGRFLKRPIVEVELIGKGSTVNAFGLIDSGADTSLMNLEYANELGVALDFSRRKNFIGISGAETPCFLSRVTMKVKHFETPITTSVAFIDSPSVDILLGQEDFFECFRIKFEKDHDTFELTLSPKAKN